MALVAFVQLLVIMELEVMQFGFVEFVEFATAEFATVEFAIETGGKQSQPVLLAQEMLIEQQDEGACTRDNHTS